jgi:hypothetical protein
VREFVIMTEEDLPRAVQQMLTRVMLPWWVAEFVEAFPRQALAFDREMALRGFLVAPGRRDLEESFADRCAGGVADVERSLASAYLPPLGEVCILGVLAHLCHAEQGRGGGDSPPFVNGFMRRLQPPRGRPEKESSRRGCDRGAWP